MVFWFSSRVCPARARWLDAVCLTLGDADALLEYAQRSGGLAACVNAFSISLSSILEVPQVVCAIKSYGLSGNMVVWLRDGMMGINNL